MSLGLLFPAFYWKRKLRVREGNEFAQDHSNNVRIGILGLRALLLTARLSCLQEGYLDEAKCKGFQSNKGKGISDRRNSLSKAIEVGKKMLHHEEEALHGWSFCCVCSGACE